MHYKLELYKISKSLNDLTISKFATLKINDLSSGQHFVNKNIRFKTPVLRLDSCNYSDVYIFVKGRISVTGTNADNRQNGKLTFKNNSQFRSSISKVKKNIYRQRGRS